MLRFCNKWDFVYNSVLILASKLHISHTLVIYENALAFIHKLFAWSADSSELVPA